MPPSPQLQQYLQSNEEEPYYILKTNNLGFFGGSRRIRSRSFHAMGTSVYQYDCRTYRQWKIDVCPTVRSQHQTHDDSQARSDLNGVMVNIRRCMEPQKGQNFNKVYRIWIIQNQEKSISSFLTISWTKRIKGWLHCLRKRVTTKTSASCTSFRICFIEENTIEP